MEKILKTIIALRRLPLESYDPRMVLRNGEVALVELPLGEVKVKVGDGVTNFSDLEYLDQRLEFEVKSAIIRGYYRNGEFYVKDTGSEKYVGRSYKIYIDIPTKKVYVYNEDSAVYSPLFYENYASETEAGIAKLYGGLGNNTDGSITQSATTQNLNKKVEMSIGSDGQTLVLNTNIL